VAGVHGEAGGPDARAVLGDDAGALSDEP